jgi:hypothetical protein
VRVYAGGNGRKTDDTDAHSIAMVGLQTPGLPVVRPDDRTVTLRLLASRRHELVGLRTQAVCRLHRDLANLVPDGAPSGRAEPRARPPPATSAAAVVGAAEIIKHVTGMPALNNWLAHDLRRNPPNRGASTAGRWGLPTPRLLRPQFGSRQRRAPHRTPFGDVG